LGQELRSVYRGINKQIVAYCASMWLFSRVPPHVDDEHVLRLEGLLLPAAVLPLADERLLVQADVVVVQVLGTQSYISLEKKLFS
jgi:hypothetical protein